MSPARPKALIFDIFGTVVDWRGGVAAEAARFFAQVGVDVDPAAFADAWRAQYQPAMERVRSGGRGYVALDILHRENLEIVLREFGLEGRFREQEKAELNRAWERLPPWPDCVPGLAMLRRDFIVAPCSNGSIALMARLARFAGLTWDAVLGADLAGAYKPMPQVYLRSCAALQLPPGEVMMVAAHNDDLAAARACGLRTAFIPRPLEHGPGQTGDLAPAADWDVVARDLPDLHQLLTM